MTSPLLRFLSICETIASYQHLPDEIMLERLFNALPSVT
jgi:hypothetical protein